MVALVSADSRLPAGVHTVLQGLAGDAPTEVSGVWLTSWGLQQPQPGPGTPLLLSTANRSPRGRVEPAAIAHWLATGNLAALREMLPPFAALGLADGGGLRLATDSLGFRPIFRCDGEGWSAVSTSALALARLRGKNLDTDAVLLQSQLGWQLGQRTPFDGVTALRAGEALLLGSQGIHSEGDTSRFDGPGSFTLDDAVKETARILREMLSIYLDETDDPTVQLTGGQDSRIVLSAIPEQRRRGLRAMTLHVPGSRDAEIAGDLAQRYGMHHTVVSVEGLERIPADQWWDRVVNAARLHDCMADPIARAVTGWAEESFVQGERLSGLGGEVARGFYYLGRVRPQSVNRRRAETLARWRMLVNDAVEAPALSPELRHRAVATSIDMVHAALVEGADEWFTATDEVYLHRMRRWAGLSEAAVSFQRSLTNPLLDPRFLAIARGLPPSAKRGSRFLGRLQVALDEELAALPLDDRPSPRKYAYPGPLNSVAAQAAILGRLVRKAAQRARGADRPVAGGEVVSRMVTAHLRQRPALLDPVRATGILDDQWLDGIVGGDVRPTASSLALLVNLHVAAGLKGSRHAQD